MRRAGVFAFLVAMLAIGSGPSAASVSSGGAGCGGDFVGTAVCEFVASGATLVIEASVQLWVVGAVNVFAMVDGGLPVGCAGLAVNLYGSTSCETTVVVAEGQQITCAVDGTRGAYRCSTP